MSRATPSIQLTDLNHPALRVRAASPRMTLLLLEIAPRSEFLANSGQVLRAFGNRFNVVVDQILAVQIDGSVDRADQGRHR